MRCSRLWLLLCCAVLVFGSCSNARADSVVLWHTSTSHPGVWSTPEFDGSYFATLGGCAGTAAMAGTCDRVMVAYGYSGIGNCAPILIGVEWPYGIPDDPYGNPDDQSCFGIDTGLFGHKWFLNGLLNGRGVHSFDLPVDNDWEGYANLYAWTGFKYTRGMEKRLGGATNVQLQIDTESCWDYPDVDWQGLGGCTFGSGLEKGYVNRFSIVATYPQQTPEPRTLLLLGSALVPLIARGFKSIVCR